MSNWPAPLYFQPGASHSAEPGHPGRIREDAAVKAAAATQPIPAVFVAMSPCRVIETRNPTGPYGGPAFAAREPRTYAFPSGPCLGIPASAVAFSINIAVIPLGTKLGWLTAWDTGSPQPVASTLNDSGGFITSNSAVVPAGAGGDISVFVTDPTQVIVDINGYYAPPGTLPLTGTAAAPALTFGDTTTGLYSDTAGTVSIATGGVNRLTVDSNGDLELPGSIRKGGALFLHNLGYGDTAVGLLAPTAGTGGQSTAIGYQALQANTTGNQNTATGYVALQANTTGGDNTALGAWTLATNTTGGYNTAVGDSALYANTSGGSNTAIGIDALASNTSGTSNTAVGNAALNSNGTGNYNAVLGEGALALSNSSANSAVGYLALQQATGTNNTALGYWAGIYATTGNYNIYIANQGSGTDTNLIRIGDSNQTQTFISGIRGVTTGNSDAIPVLIDSNGQLGTASSSHLVKSDIEDMGDTTGTILALHPVRFRYQVHGPDSPLQFGLIAEEVAEIAPDLVARDKDGQIETVHYDKVNAMLLNEVQKLHRENQALESRLAELEGMVRGSVPGPR